MIISGGRFTERDIQHESGCKDVMYFFFYWCPLPFFFISQDSPNTSTILSENNHYLLPLSVSVVDYCKNIPTKRDKIHSLM